MKRFLILSGVIMLDLSLLVLYSLDSGGFFRKVTEPNNSGTILHGLKVLGAEDIAISRQDSFLIISSDDRGAHLNGRKPSGGLYFVDLTSDPLQPRLLTSRFEKPFFPHGISMIEMDHGVFRIFAISHYLKSHSIEVFDLIEDSLTHIRTIEDPALISPNDLVALDGTRFYVTNDHQYPTGWLRKVEDYAGLALSDVRYYDGNKFTKVADNIAYANGINYDFERKLLFVASPRGFLVKVFRVEESRNLTHIEDIDAGTGVDNIEFDAEGKLWIGCHPNLMHFSGYMAGKSPVAPSEIVIIDYRGAGDFDLQSIFLDDGSTISASTVAVPFGSRVFIGSVMDEEVIVWEK
ncbi:MAG: hypothetical protein RJQ14_10755 [Marinoscillum sp.]